MLNFRPLTRDALWKRRPAVLLKKWDNLRDVAKIEPRVVQLCDWSTVLGKGCPARGARRGLCALRGRRLEGRLPGTGAGPGARVGSSLGGTWARQDAKSEGPGGSWVTLELSFPGARPGATAEQAAGRDRMELRARPEAVPVTRSPGLGPRRAVALSQAALPRPLGAPASTPRRRPGGVWPGRPRAPPNGRRGLWA